jgi:monovalent cation:H+ antiporter-2, CPA2 family
MTTCQRLVSLPNYSMHNELLEDLLLLMVLGMPMALVARRLGLSTLVAYLGAGAVARGFVKPDDVHILAELGASLLLFAIGLEMDLVAMRRRLKQIIIAALGQLGGTIGAATLVLAALGLDWTAAFAIGCCLGLSSTLVVLRALEERGLRHRNEGQTVIGLLLTQDICLPILLVILALVLSGSEGPGLGSQVIGLVVIGVGTLLLRRFLGASLLSRILAAGLPELEIAFSITVALGAAWLSDFFGIGAAAGAFCAGLAMGSDEHRHAVETSIRPFEGLLAIVFFISIGMQFDAGFVLNHLPTVIGALLVSVVLKAVLAAQALRLSGLTWPAAIGCGLIVGQIGEFSFVLAAAGYQGGDGPIASDDYHLIVAVACLSLALTPLLIAIAVPLLPRSPLERIVGRSQKIVIAGLGPVGNTVVSALHETGHELFLVDRNPKLLAPWERTARITCLQAGIEDLESWLPKIGARPRVVVLSFPIADTSALVADRIRKLDPRLPIIARCPYRAQIPVLTQAGVQHVICDEDATIAALEPLLVEVLAQDRRLETQSLSVVDKPGTREDS